VNSSRIWDNRNAKRHLPRGLFLFMVLLGLLSAATIISFTFSRQPKTWPVASAQPAQVPAAYPPDSFKSVQQLLHEQNSLDDILWRELTTPPPPATPDCTVQACLALSFDDGPDPSTTPVILNILRTNGVHATFFLVGIRVGGNAQIVRQIVEDGNEVGNHSWTHADFTKLTPAQMLQQIDQTQNAITAASGVTPRLFRPPYGSTNATVRKQVKLPIVLWNVDPKDWKQKDPKQLVQIVESQAKPGGIIVMHDMHPTTVAALDQIVKNLQTHYKLVTISELLNLAPNTQGVFFGR
jgi:peptidoglycan/xylan/chitin deacetylase (PgdA/CDA1 family)